MPQFGVAPRQQNTLVYEGAGISLVPTINASRAPTGNDTKYPIQTIWHVGINPTTGTYGDQYILTKFNPGNPSQAVWVKFASGSGSEISYIVNRTTTATDYSVQLTDYYVGVTNTSAPRTITLPNNATAGQTFVIKDESGGATTNNITIVVSGGANIDGSSSKILNSNYQAVNLIFTGTQYFVW